MPGATCRSSTPAPRPSISRAGRCRAQSSSPLPQVYCAIGVVDRPGSCLSRILFLQFRRVQQHINHRLSTPYNSSSNSSLALRNGHCGGRHAARLRRPGGLPQGQGRAGPVRGGALLRLHPGLGGQRDHRLGPQREDVAAVLASFATFQPNIDSTLISCLSRLQCRRTSLRRLEVRGFSRGVATLFFPTPVVFP